jgi:hypothetical protein
MTMSIRPEYDTGIFNTLVWWVLAITVCTSIFNATCGSC